MGQPLLSYPNWLDATYYTVAFSGSVGSWNPSFPLTNLRNRRFSSVARTTGVTLAATKMLIDLGTQRSIKALAIPSSNIERNGLVRARIYQDSGLTTLTGDTDWTDYWRTVYAFGSLPFEHPSWLDGKLTEEDRQGYPMPWIYTFISSILGRYVLLEFDDTTNSAGYLDIPRVYICPGWEPTTGIQVGANIGYVDPSGAEESFGSVLFFDERPGYRTTRFTVAMMDNSEAFSTAWELIRSLKKTKELFFSVDPTDDTNVHRWSFPATIRELSPIEWPTELYNSVAFELREVVG